MKKRIVCTLLVAILLIGMLPTAFAEDADVIKGVVTCSSTVNVRNNPRTTSTKIGTLKNGTEVEIFETTMSNGHKWGRLEEGWVCMDYITVVDGTTTQTSTESTVVPNTPPTGASVSGVIANTDRVNIRESAGVGYKLVTTLIRGTKVNVYNLVDVKGTKWGQIDQGWVCMDYVQLTNALPTTPTTGTTTTTPESSTETVTTSNTGKVISNSNLNVREAAGVGNKLVTTLRPGTVVTVLEREVVKGVSWGRIDKGWICLDYIQFNTVSSNTESAPSTGNLTIGNGSTQISYTGTIVNCSSGVNIRSAAGVGNKLVGTAKLGSQVTILDVTTVKGTEWGRIDKGWICMDYVKLGAMSLNPTTPSTSTGTGTTTTTPSGNAVVVCNSTVNVREAAGVSKKLVTTLRNGTAINVYEQTDVKGVAWGRIDQGWICMQYVKMNAASTGNTSSSNTSTSTGNTTSTTEPSEILTTIPSDAIAIGFASQNLDCYGGSGFGYEKIGSVAKLNFVVIYETKLEGGVSWARTNKGWVILSYVAVTAVGSSSEGEQGFVANTYGGVNVRNSPVYNSIQLCKIAASSPVRIYEQKNGYGRTDIGWVSMDYITLGAIPEGEFAK